MSWYPKTVNSIAAKLKVTSELPSDRRNFTILWKLLGRCTSCNGETFAQILDSTSSGGFTLFAPTDAAFERLEEMSKKNFSIGSLSEEKLCAVMLYHILAGVVTCADLEDGATPTTISGKNLFIISSEENGKREIFVNSSKIMACDIRASNGVVHAISNVLIPLDECRRSVMLQHVTNRSIRGKSRKKE